MIGPSDPESETTPHTPGPGTFPAGESTPTDGGATDAEVSDEPKEPQPGATAPVLGSAAAALIAEGRSGATSRTIAALFGAGDRSQPKPTAMPGPVGEAGESGDAARADTATSGPSESLTGQGGTRRDVPEDSRARPQPGAPESPPTAETAEESGRTSGFRLRLSNFEGPFDLLLTLISSRKLDVTEVALHKVTDEFIAYTKALTASMAGQDSGLRADKILDQTTEFLVVAATLLDLKAARLLPSGEMTDTEDLALLEARDLLFARLLQYRAFKQVAELLGELEAAALRRYPRAVGLEERYMGLLPEVTLGVGASEFAAIAAAAFRPRPVPTVGLDHLHQHPISVAEQAAIVLERLKQRGAGAWTAFGELVADCEVPVQIVARFLALLELYRGRTIEFDQPDPLGPLRISWLGDDAADRADEMTIEEDYG